jgi:hypothetical protein
MDKLLTYHRQHHTSPATIVRDLKFAADQIPTMDRAGQAEPLQKLYEKSQTSRRRGPTEIGTLVVAVLERLGVTDRIEQ